MLSRRLLFIAFFVVFVGIRSQNAGTEYKTNNDADDADDADDKNGEKPQVNNPQILAKNNNNAANQVLQSQTMNVQKPIVTPVAAAQIVPKEVPVAPSVRSRAVPLWDSTECKADVQKYCSKGSTAAIPNLKVLQCVDDLDNVSDRLVDFLL
jgi:hypothetical protein